MKLEKIESYLLNKMDAETRQAFEKQMAEDAALEKEVRLQEKAYLVLDTLGDQKMKKKLNDIHAKVIERKPKRKGKKLVFGLITSLLLILGTAYYFLVHKANAQETSPPKIYAQYFESYPISLASRGDDHVLELHQVNKLYANQKYEEALPIVEKLLKESPDTKLYLAAGISALQIGQFDVAYKHFNFLIDNNDLLYKNQALWYAALSALKEDNKILAKEYLQSLVDSPDRFKREESQAILQLLK